MRNKKAKKLRSAARVLTIGEPAVQYTTKKHFLGVDHKGFKVNRFQVLLSKHCTRYLYKKIKKSVKRTA